jgi:hypothetical protein
MDTGTTDGYIKSLKNEIKLLKAIITQLIEDRDLLRETIAARKAVGQERGKNSGA